MSEVLSAITAGRSPHLSSRWAPWIIAVLVALSLGSCSFFHVPRGHFGVIARTPADSGLNVVDAGVHIKWPWQSVEQIDGRIRLADLPPREKRLGDGETVVVHPYAAYRVEPGNAVLFLGAGGEAAVATQLSELLWRALDIELAAGRLTDLLGPQAAEQSNHAPLTKRTDGIYEKCRLPALTRFGVQLLDVRVSRLVGPEGKEPQILQRMIADRRRRVDRQRSAAAAEVSAIVNAAQAEADRLRAEAEARVGQIEQDTEKRIAAAIQNAGFDPGFRELVLNVERYHRLLEENASVVISDGKFFDALFAPGAASRPQSQPAATASASRPENSESPQEAKIRTSSPASSGPP